VDDREVAVLEMPDKAFSETAEGLDYSAFNVVNRRFDRPQQKRTDETHALEPLSDDASAQGVEVELDVR
jgi:hypothetical protein